MEKYTCCENRSILPFSLLDSELPTAVRRGFWLVVRFTGAGCKPHNQQNRQVAAGGKKSRVVTFLEPEGFLFEKKCFVGSPKEKKMATIYLSSTGLINVIEFAEIRSSYRNAFNT